MAMLLVLKGCLKTSDSVGIAPHATGRGQSSQIEQQDLAFFIGRDRNLILLAHRRAIAGVQLLTIQARAAAQDLQPRVPARLHVVDQLPARLQLGDIESGVLVDFQRTFGHVGRRHQLPRVAAALSWESLLLVARSQARAPGSNQI